jgi:transposase
LRVGRWDLKRFVLRIAANQQGIPLVLQKFSGIESDKESIKKIIRDLKEILKSQDKVYHVADSEFYTTESLHLLGQHTFWISRVPGTIGLVKELENADSDLNSCKDSRYSYFEYRTRYADIDQKWVVYHSDPRYKHQEKTFMTKLDKNLDKPRNSLKKLTTHEFVCEPDAMAAAEKWWEKNGRYRFRDFLIVPVNRKNRKTRRRPKTDEPMTVSYSIEAIINYKPEFIKQEMKKLGRFILATNDIDLSPDKFPDPSPCNGHGTLLVHLFNCRISVKTSIGAHW